MLSIYKRKTQLHESIIIGLIAIVLMFGLILILTMLDALWYKDTCGNVPLSDYTSKSAPSKCQALWEEGKLW